MDTAVANDAAVTGVAPGADAGAHAPDAHTPLARVPADLLELTDFKLTLPIAVDDGADQPLEIKQPALASFVLEPWFRLNAGADGVVFRAHAGGATTRNSGYPRSELREMTDRGETQAAWSTGVGIHSMTIRQAITHLPEVKPHVVAGQIHDAEDDVVMIRLERQHLFVEGGGEELGDLSTDYVLGTEFSVTLRADSGVIEVYYNQQPDPVVSLERDLDGCYFKAGVYTQSNTDRGDDPDAYGEVAIYDLVVTHE